MASNLYKKTHILNSVTLLSVTTSKQRFWRLFLGDEQTSNSLLYKETLLSAVLGFGRNWIKICLDILLKH